MATAYRRLLLKLSGEALSGGKGYGFDTPTIDSMCSQIAEVVQSGIQLGIVVGGGNIFRGLPASEKGMDRVTGDTMGMLATIINGLALTDALNETGIKANHMASVAITGMVDQFHQRRALELLENGRTLVFSGGTGNPFFSTDTAAALRAAQIKADGLLKGTKVDGVYNGDPVTDTEARKYDTISYTEVLERGLRVMDAAAIAMCRDNNIPVVVFNFTTGDMLTRVVNGEPVGTTVKEDANG